MSEPVWIRQDVVLTMHEEALMLHGGLEGLRDLGLLESALARPKNLFAYSEKDPSLAQLAASYAKRNCRESSIRDGNKRTAFTVSVTFLKVNGLQLNSINGRPGSHILGSCRQRNLRRAVSPVVEGNTAPRGPGFPLPPKISSSQAPP